MQTVLLKPNCRGLKKAGKILRNGGIVAFPTETVFGLGANACDEIAVKKIFAAKNRPQDNPLILHFANKKQILPYVKNLNSETLKLFKMFPAPLTVVCDKTEKVNKTVSAHLSTVAVRVPKNKLARKLIRFAKVPLAAPSANISTRPSGTVWQDVACDFKGKIDAIICGKPSNIGIESTVVDVRNGIAKVLRLGGTSVETLNKHRFKTQLSIKSEDAVHSPGTRYRHYSPKCNFVVARLQNSMAEKIKAFCKDKENVVVFCKSENAHFYKGLNVEKLGTTPAEIAKNIFAFMRRAENRFDTIICESFEDEKILKAVNNRIFKAASQII